MDPISLLESDSEDDDEFFDAVDAGEVEVTMLPTSPSLALVEPKSKADVKEDVHPVSVPSSSDELTLSFKGYEDGIRKRLAMDADERPKVSLWVSGFPQLLIFLC